MLHGLLTDSVFLFISTSEMTDNRIAEENVHPPRQALRGALLKYKIPEIALNSQDQQSVETQPEVMSQNHRRPKLQWRYSSLNVFICLHELHLDDAWYMPPSFCLIWGWSPEISSPLCTYFPPFSVRTYSLSRKWMSQ